MHKNYFNCKRSIFSYIMKKSFRYFPTCLTLLAILLLTVPASAAKNNATDKAIVKVLTYDAQDKPLQTGYGFFLSQKGEAIAPYTLLKDACRAEVKDSKGKTWKVMRIQGASDIYDVVKFSTDCKESPALPLAQQPATKGAQVTRYLSNGDKGLTPLSAQITEAKKYDNLTYYTLTSKADNATAGTPLLDDKGQVIGIMQKSADKDLTKSYAADVAVVQFLSTSGLSAGQSVLQSIHIPKQLPADTLQAATYLYLLQTNSSDSTAYLTALEDFKQIFPQKATGYVEHAAFAASRQQFAQAETEYEAAFQHADNQAEVHYNFSKLLYRLNMYKSYQTYKDWTLEKALNEAQQAYEIMPMPLYQLQIGDCQFALKQYDAAFQTYQAVNASDFRSEKTFFYAARTRELMDDDSTVVLALMDSAMFRFPEPYSSEAGPYLLQRAQLRYKYGQYRKSALDFDAYEKLIGSHNLNDNFFYMKEQADLAAHIYPWAMSDIEKCLSIRPNDYLYIVEKAIVHLHVGDYEEAIYEAQRAAKIDSKGADAYKVIGIAYGQQGNKTEALKYLNQAKTLGDPQVDEWIEKLK